MKGLLTLAWFLACSVPAVPGSLLDLSTMIEKVTGKPALTNYGFYGCYCGWGGQGTPKDGTDWCCWVHDYCYAQLEEKGCNTLTQSYKYRVAWGLVTCGKAGASIQATGATPRGQPVYILGRHAQGRRGRITATVSELQEKD
uniref:Phospholipase A2 n=1 Tax=Sus scrofa TaxID=9823 RepID=A0A8D1VE37_PIG